MPTQEIDPRIEGFREMTRKPASWMKMRTIRSLNLSNPSESPLDGFVWFRLEDVMLLHEATCFVCTEKNSFQVHPDDFAIITQAFEAQL